MLNEKPEGVRGKKLEANPARFAKLYPDPKAILGENRNDTVHFMAFSNLEYVGLITCQKT